ncbi:hypothetical protein P153DRAFT_364925 [Dothidotthia symphoricarpi CBS 119687]|uniref:Uncharacterized protein n=1 Tax=Dothidotthia symphoricarpi CBS 119687 TaxID=1392245 RepID=A0A6A6AJN9_9PLEO|nr:uncharacterized protein P153DRAFT_364925 [Dothidotthia symphoricarpi CBS 119687]KAF2131328.1 hypothetical protein P153DRAFT_364925 [Dothidotthia symphoricarpi CBS 119687]
MPGYLHPTISRLAACSNCPLIGPLIPTPSHMDSSLSAYSVGGPSTMSLAYKVEELLALRDSVSESAVSIDKFADEDVIKGQ